MTDHRERLERDLKECDKELRWPLKGSGRPRRVRYSTKAQWLLSRGWRHQDEGAVSNSCAEGLQRHHAAELLHQRLLAEVTVSWVGKYDTGFQDNLMVWCLKMIKDIYAVDDYRALSGASRRCRHE